ncbi:MAG: PQQ-binding-like beta-propeller repeat protein [Planctomycetales bacterium]
MRSTGLLLIASIGVAAIPANVCAGDWRQFRGPQGAGNAVGEQALPTEIGPDRHVVWKTPLPPGHSSPVLTDDRIYLTAVEGESLWTMGLDRDSGRVLWKVAAPHERLESIHRIGSHAQASPVTDGERVISLFGSCGMFCYDRDGQLLWRVPLGPFKNDFGVGSSPILIDDSVVLVQDHDTDSFLAVYDKQTGREIWRVDRSEFTRNYASPTIWTVAGRRQIVCASSLRVIGYDLESGRELWTVRGIARFVGATPIVGEDGMLYIAGWGAGGDVGGDKIVLAPFDEYAKEFDQSGNGSIEESEVPEGPVKMRFSQIDRDKDGSITRQEYDSFKRLLDQGRNSVLAIRPGGSGEITDTHVAWTYLKHVPFCATPVLAQGRLFAIKDGGILTALDARTGKPYKQARLSSAGDYYSSPVVGDGKVYLTNETGQLTVVSSDGDWRVLHTADFGENVYATPAIVDGRIYFRTAGTLYCFKK